MYIKFWGTRGSIPAPLSSDDIKLKIQQALEGAAGLDLTDSAVIDRYINRLPGLVRGTVGGNTICIEIQSDDHLLILDAGSGLRLLGLDMMERGFAKGNQQADFLVTHTHWDHVQGFPFFRPAFIPGNQFTFHSPFADLRDRLSQQQNPVFFPVSIAYMNATLNFQQIDPNQTYHIGPYTIRAMRTIHPGESYIYRIEDKSSCVVYATDSEYKQVDRASTRQYIEFFKEADLLIFDAQYSLSEALDKLDWGHSTALIGAELAHRAQAKRVALFHHDPVTSDEKIWQTKEQAEVYLTHHHPNQTTCEILVAQDGLVLEL